MAIKLIVFDHDGTLVSFPYAKQHTSSWGAIFLAAGLQKEREDAYEIYNGKKELAREWAIHDMKLLGGIAVSKVIEKVFPPHYLPGVLETVPEIKKAFPGAKLGILSGGLDLVTKETAKELGLDFQIATETKMENGLFTGEHGFVVDIWKKGDILRNLMIKEKISPDETCFIGDHDIDVCCFKLCRYSIAVHPDNENVKKSATAWTNDFRDLLGILKNMDSET